MGPFPQNNLLGVSFKISNDHPNTFFMRALPLPVIVIDMIPPIIVIDMFFIWF